MDYDSLRKLAALIRYYILISTSAAGSGHATSSLSSVELATVLFFKHYRFNPDYPDNPANDRFILSKGHASPLLYSLYAAAGKVSEAELLTLRRFDSPLEGHPTMNFKYTEVPTGSLGQGLSVGLGMALALHLVTQDKPLTSLTPVTPLRSYIYILLGDGEMAEGQNWEAIQIASYYKLNNIIGLLDVNSLGQTDPTMLGYDLDAWQKRFTAFGWRTYVVNDGHSVEQVDEALGKAIADSASSGTPAMIIAKTLKGKGVSFLENHVSLHGVPVKKEDLPKALAELGPVDKNLTGIIQPPSTVHPQTQPSILNPPSPQLPISPSPHLPIVTFTGYSVGSSVATRKAYGTGLVRLGNMYPDVVALDGDVKNSTYAGEFKQSFPERFFDMFIAEQNMVSAAVGLARMGRVPFVSSFGCFLSRAADQIRMAAFSGRHIVLCGSHAGVSIGEDGPSQMGLEDLALFRSVFGSTVLYPSDGVSTERLVEAAYKEQGIVYIRTARPESPVIYSPDVTFPVGGSHIFGGSSIIHPPPSTPTIHPQPSTFQLTIIAAGITLHESLKAQRKLIDQGIAVRVIDCYSVKPIDTGTLKKAALDSKALLVVEDHYSEGGLGDAVREALSETPVRIYHLSVTRPPRSGSTAQLLAYEGIDSEAITAKVKQILTS